VAAGPTRRHPGWRITKWRLGIAAFIYMFVGAYVTWQSFRHWQLPILGGLLAVLWVASFLFLVHLALLLAEGEYPARKRS
jgi:hypothetical protein